MRVSDLKTYEGDIVVLDLINGIKLTTKIESVANDGFVVTGKLVEFHVVQQLKDRSKPPYTGKRWECSDEYILRVPSIRNWGK